MTLRSPEFLVCPCCRGRLFAGKSTGAKSVESLLCPACGLAFPVIDEVPMMVPHDAVKLTEAKAEELRKRVRQADARAARPGASGVSGS